MGQLVLGIVGAGVGFVASGGNPLGASIGFFVGSALGGLIFPNKVNAPSVPPTLLQRSSYGSMLPIAFGAARAPANMIWEGGISTHTSSSRSEERRVGKEGRS